MRSDPSFVEYFNKTTGFDVKFKEKQSSWLMHVVSFGLGILTWLKLVNITRSEFMNSYTIVIGKTVYSGTLHSYDPPTRLMVHELTHVAQWAQGYITYALGYLLSSRIRTRYESQCIQAEWLVYPDAISTDKRRSKEVVELGLNLLAYGSHTAFQELETRLKEIDGGNPNSLSRMVADVTKKWIALYGQPT